MLLAAVAPGLARAADWRFLPSMGVGAYHDGNTGVTGSGSSDDVIRVGVDLDFEWDTQSTQSRLSYAPYREFYDELDDLDYTAHNLTYTLAHDVSRRSSFDLEVGGLLTERQPIQTLRPDTAVTLVPRGKQISGYLDLSGRVGLGKRSFFDWQAFGDRTEFPDDPAGTQTDTDSYGLAAGGGVELAESTAVGARARGKRLGFEGASTDLFGLELFFDHEFSRTLSLALSAGAERAATSTADSISARFQATLTQAFRNGSELEGGLRQEVSSAAGVTSATLDRGAYVTLRPKDRAERFSAQITAYFWTREEAESSAPNIDIQTFEAVASLSWSPKGGHFALGGFYSYHDQTDASGVALSVESKYSSGGVFFRWNFQGVRGVGS